MAGGKVGRALTKTTKTTAHFPAASTSDTHRQHDSLVIPHQTVPDTRELASTSKPLPAGYSAYGESYCLPEAPAALDEITRLDALRRGLGCTQAQLASMIDVSPSALSRLFRLPHQTQTLPHVMSQTRKATRSKHSSIAPLATHAGLQRIELALTIFSTMAPADRPPRTQRPVVAVSATFGRQTPWHSWHQQGDVGHTSGMQKDTIRTPLQSLQSGQYVGVATPTATLRHRNAAPSLKHKRTPYRLLIAEDDWETAALYEMLFGAEDRLQYELVVAATAKDCLGLLHMAQRSRSARYDLLLMDLGLSERHGATTPSLLSQLCQRPRWVPAEVLVVSGASPYQLHSRTTDLKELGVAYLPKPFDIDELLEAVYRLVTGANTNIAALAHLRQF